MGAAEARNSSVWRRGAVENVCGRGTDQERVEASQQSTLPPLTCGGSGRCVPSSRMAPLADRGWSSEAMNWVVADGSVERTVTSSTRHIALG